MNEYNSKNIQVLEGLSPVRKRPGMYIGNTGTGGLHQLVWEVLDNSLDEHLAGYCDEIVITLNKDLSVTVEDNGRGIPVDNIPNTKDYPKDKYPNGISAERVIMTTLHAGGKFDNESYKVSGGLHGVGISVVNALSSYVKVEVFKDQNYYIDEYHDGGIPITELIDGELPKIKNTNKRGTKITFVPDDTIFESVLIKDSILSKRLKELSYLNPGLKIILKNKETEEEQVFKSEEGIVGFVKDLNKKEKAVYDSVIHYKGEQNNIEVEIAFQHKRSFTEHVVSFCNNVNTVEGGTHVSGFKTSLTKIVNKYLKTVNGYKVSSLEGKDVRGGLTAVISVKHQDPQFEGQTKTKLGNSDARTTIEEVSNKEMEILFDRDLDLVKELIENGIKHFNVRKTEMKAKKQLLNKQSAFSSNGKLATCRKTLNPQKGVLTELFIVEGDSAGGSAKQGRNRDIQAILPLRGKVLNTEKHNISKLLGNKEITTMINAFGCGFGEGYGNDFDISKVKYDKLIIMTDADVDGSHIRTLILTFLYNYMKDLILEGKVYSAIPPLYKVKANGKEQYLYSEKEFEEYRKKHTNFSLQRFKGLGEMNQDQLWNTTMNPKTRKLNKIIIDDMTVSDDLTVKLMGTNVEARRQFIEEEADKANIDL